MFCYLIYYYNFLIVAQTISFVYTKFYAFYRLIIDNRFRINEYWDEISGDWKGARKIGLTVMNSRQQNHEDEGDDRRETVCNHDHDHRTMCFRLITLQSVTSDVLPPPSLHGKFARGRSDYNCVNIYINFL